MVVSTCCFSVPAFPWAKFFPVPQVVVRHREDSLVIGHVADNTGHIDKPGQFSGTLAAVSSDDLISAALTGTHQCRLIDPGSLDRFYQPLHLRIVPDAKGMIFEWVHSEKLRYTISSFTPRAASRGAGGCSAAAEVSALMGASFLVGGLFWDILSRGCGLTLWGAVLSALGERSLRGLVVSFALSARLPLSRAAVFSEGLLFVAPSRAAIKSTTFPVGAGSPTPGIVVCFSPLFGGTPSLRWSGSIFVFGGLRRGVLPPWTHLLSQEPLPRPEWADPAPGEQLWLAPPFPAWGARPMCSGVENILFIVSYLKTSFVVK